MRFAVVDGYSTGRFLVQELRTLGASCIHVHSQPLIPEYYQRSFAPQDYESDLGYIKNADTAAAAIRRWHVNGVVAGTESGVLLADTLTYLLSMPGNDVGRLQGRRNKLLMAQYLQEAGLATPRCEVVSSPEEGRRWAYANNLSEVVVKPVDSAASDNVRFCHVDDDLYAACQDVLSASNFFGQGNEAVLVQERLVGREYYVNTVSVNGEHRVAETWQYTKRLGRSPVYDFEEPCDVADCRISTLHTYVKDALTALGIRYGAAHSEVMYTKRGPMLIETGARLGGGVLPWVAAKYSGVSHVGLLARALVDPNQLLRFNESTVLWNHRVRYVSLINHTGGEVTSLQWRDKISSLDSVAAVVSTVLPGDRIVPTVDLATSPGYAYLISESKDSIMRDYRTIRLWEAEGLYTRAA